MLKDYYNLAKPGIVYGNLLTTIAAYLFASRWHFDPIVFLATMLGLGLVIAAACVFNNCLDRGIDRKMARTKDRALVAGRISTRNAIYYGILLGVLGIYFLAGFVNILSAIIALFGFVMYVLVYGAAKRLTSWGTVIGSISGAVPIVVGYVAVTDRLDIAAGILFLTLALWQMPHFYSISIYRLNEYIAASIPVLPAQKGILATKRSIFGYIIAFIIAAALLTAEGAAGYLYLAAMVLIGLWWLCRAFIGFKAADDVAWARKLFFMSLIVLLFYSAILAIAPFLPL